MSKAQESDFLTASRKLFDERKSFIQDRNKYIHTKSKNSIHLSCSNVGRFF